jgi:dihydroflavonol-4-reductase
MGATKLVMGASGFLGAHVVRELVDRGEQVRAIVRPTSSLRGIDGVRVEVVVGDTKDPEFSRAAMAGCDVVFYCIVDARPWLRDSSVLFETNVVLLRQVLDVAAETGLRKFVFTSSVATLPIAGRPVDESAGPHNWMHLGGDYVRSRVDAEELVLTYARDRGLPAVAMCVANTYGADDHLPTPHGGLLAAAARGKMPFYVREAAAEVVGITDAARALVLAGDRGVVGERYIVSEKFMTTREIHEIAADVTGAPHARWGIPARILGWAGAIGEVVARVRKRDSRLTRTTVRLMHTMTPLDHSKAERDLGWTPRPTEESIRDAAVYFTTRRREPPS